MAMYWKELNSTTTRRVSTYLITIRIPRMPHTTGAFCGVDGTRRAKIIILLFNFSFHVSSLLKIDIVKRRFFL